MSPWKSRYILLGSVFMTGACVLIIEVVAVRALAPFFGNTIFTVSSVISVILLALSVGYFFGGRMADREPSMQRFFYIIMVSGIMLLLLHALGTRLLPILSSALSLSQGPLVAALVLFLAPALLLGTLSPYAIKLQSTLMPERGVGSVSGEIFFWSTLGSIVGSLSSGFVLIPHFGIDHIFLGTGITLFVLGFSALGLQRFDRKRLQKAFLAVATTVFITLYSVEPVTSNVQYNGDGVYEKILIYDGLYKDRLTRFLQQDQTYSNAMFLDSDDPTDLAYDYSKYYLLYTILKPDLQTALFIGGGAYSIPKALIAALPTVSVDVAEIEPSLFELAKQHFHLGDVQRLHNYTEDGRRLLSQSTTSYDLIFSDVYSTLYSVPTHFTTQEFFSTAKAKLSDGGIFMANIIGDLSRQQPSLMMSEIKTFQSVFPNSIFLAVVSPQSSTPQNIIMVGSNSDQPIDLNNPRVHEHPNPIIRSLSNHNINLARFDLAPYPILTDNYAPTEYLNAALLQRLQNAVPLIDGNEILAVIAQQMRYGPRIPGTVGHKRTQDFLMAEMSVLVPEVQQQHGSYIGADGVIYPLTNIIGRLYPDQSRRIILATHYDSKVKADQDPVHPDHSVPGANDSASGVALLVELARYFATAETVPQVGIDFVFFDGEEGDWHQGSDPASWRPLGSTYFADHLLTLYPTVKPEQAIVLDMLCDKDLHVLREQGSARDATQQTNTLWRIAHQINSDVFREDTKPEIFDDHTPLNAAGIPSTLMIDFDYPAFHTTNDTIDRCSAGSLGTVAETVIKYIRTLN